ncbi:hypothetical protein FAI41_05900 [Acetobacteraceae bacterium]|nr:hypothetical protein FAI41_05900 [Acetobacteraceae bacterium]
MLCHLNDFDVARTLLNFKLSNSRYLVVSTKDGHTNNRSKVMTHGRYEPLLLTEEPFRFPAPEIRSLFYDFYLLDKIPLEAFTDLLRRTNINR